MYHTELILNTQLINKAFMENMLYKQNTKFVDLKDVFLNYDKYIPITNHLQRVQKKLPFQIPLEIILYDFNYLFVLRSQSIPLNQTDYFLSLVNKFGYIMYDVLDCYIHNTTNITNIFVKEHVYPNFYSNPICQWIIKEANIHNKKMVILNVDQIPHLFRFCISGFQQIMQFKLVTQLPQ